MNVTNITITLQSRCDRATKLNNKQNDQNKGKCQENLKLSIEIQKFQMNFRFAHND